MKKLPVDFDEIQKAMEDTDRDAFDYFLDTETGDVIILSEDIISRAKLLLDETMEDDISDYDEVELSDEYDIPDWMEDEVELALDIFLHEPQQYLRIPERQARDAFAAMQAFAASLEDAALKTRLSAIVSGKGAFRKFKDELGPYPRERKQWYGYNATAVRNEIIRWLNTAGIVPADNADSGKDSVSS